MSAATLGPCVVWGMSAFLRGRACGRACLGGVPVGSGTRGRTITQAVPGASKNRGGGCDGNPVRGSGRGGPRMILDPEPTGPVPCPAARLRAVLDRQGIAVV